MRGSFALERRAQDDSKRDKSKYGDSGCARMTSKTDKGNDGDSDPLGQNDDVRFSSG